SMNEQKNILDFIHSKKTDSPDEVFFENLAADIIAKQQQPIIKMPFYKKSVFKWSAAAAIVISFVFYFGQLEITSSPEFAQLNQLSDETILNYLESTKPESSIAIAEVSNYQTKNTDAIFLSLEQEVDQKTIIQYVDDVYGDWEEETDLFDLKN